MKNVLYMILCFVLFFCIALGVSACNSKMEAMAKKEPEAVTSEETVAVKLYITGRYELETVRWKDGTTASGEVLQEAEDTMGNMYVELFSDGTAQLSLYGQIRDMEFSEDKIWEIGQADKAYEFSVSNGKATLKDAGDTYIFSKE